MGLEQFVDRPGVFTHDLEDGSQRVVGREIGRVEFERLLVLADREIPFLLPDEDLGETHADLRSIALPAQRFPVGGDGFIVHRAPLVHHAQQFVGDAVPGGSADDFPEAVGRLLEFAEKAVDPAEIHEQGIGAVPALEGVQHVAAGFAVAFLFHVDQADVILNRDFFRILPGAPAEPLEGFARAAGIHESQAKPPQGPVVGLASLHAFEAKPHDGVVVLVRQEELELMRPEPHIGFLFQRRQAPSKGYGYGETGRAAPSSRYLEYTAVRRRCQADAAGSGLLFQRAVQEAYSLVWQQLRDHDK